ncbi:hypothetical protein JHK82_012352 [Glycine max]|nr:hypothetical protein JHK85_012708 [Glycine max]KAG5057375.1 hypothetical protein JHK86_012371 [Glycine max]KAG5154383.1 hypothetical protein JHK82_012352 [Glycine max]
MAQIQAKDLFEVKVDILRVMAGLDLSGDWIGWDGGREHWKIRNLDSNVSVRFSGRNTGKLHSILDGNEVLRILPETRRSFRDLQNIFEGSM